MTGPDPGREARTAEVTAATERRARLTAEHGRPEHVSGPDALALAEGAGVPVDPRVTAGDVLACIYRDEAAADAWAESNMTHYGHPLLAKVPLPDGRVVGILDLRPALEKFAQEEGP
jgi:hypothetical protein